MNSRDIDYYARRAQQERDRAAQAKDTTARRVHQEMAERYSAWLREVGALETEQLHA